MQVQYVWRDFQKEIDNIIKNLNTSQKSHIIDAIWKQSNKIFTNQNLSLIYDKYGTQLYEKNSNVYKYIQCVKNGFSLNLNVNESYLKKIIQKNNFNTDFLPYGSLNNINSNDVKFNMDIDFYRKNGYLYNDIELNKRKEEAINFGIEKVKNWINKTGQQELLKYNFVGFIK